VRLMPARVGYGLVDSEHIGWVFHRMAITKGDFEDLQDASAVPEYVMQRLGQVLDLLRTS
jgi:hypothetical protein